MKFETISYKRVKNLGNYQSETLEVSAVLEDGEDVDKEYENLRNLVLNKLGILPSKDEDENLGGF